MIHLSAFLPTALDLYLPGDPILFSGNTLLFQKTQKVLPSCLKLSQLVSPCLHSGCLICHTQKQSLMAGECKFFFMQNMPHSTKESKRGLFSKNLHLRMCSDNLCPDASVQMHISDVPLPDQHAARTPVLLPGGIIFEMKIHLHTQIFSLHL